MEELDKLALALGGRTKIRTVPLGCEGGAATEAMGDAAADFESAEPDAVRGGGALQQR